jgi:hypothetical protein
MYSLIEARHCTPLKALLVAANGCNCSVALYYFSKNLGVYIYESHCVLSRAPGAFIFGESYIIECPWGSLDLLFLILFAFDR